MKKSTIKNLFPFILFLLIIITFIFLQPTSVSSLPFINRQSSWNTFIQKNEGKRLDTKLFWQIREFYSPGHSVYKKEGLALDKQKQLLEKIGWLEKELGNQIIISEYNSSSVITYDSLVPNKNKANIQKSIKNLAGKPNVLGQGENFVVIKTQSKTSVLIFLASLEEMKKTNGIFTDDLNYEKWVKDKSWLSISEIVTE